MKYSWLFAVALCAVILPFSTAEMSEATPTTTPTEAFPDFLKQDLEAYEALKGDMQRALGLKTYAKHLSTATTEVNLDEKVIIEELVTAHNLVQISVDKARRVVRLMKEHCSVIVLALGPSVAGPDQEKLWTALKYFPGFSKATEDGIEEVEGALLQASNILHNLSCILEHEQVHFLNKNAKANSCQNLIVYVTVTVVGTVSLFYIPQPIGPLLATGFTIIFAGSTTERKSIEGALVHAGMTMVVLTMLRILHKRQYSVFFGHIIGLALSGILIEGYYNNDDFQQQQQETTSGYIRAFEQCRLRRRHYKSN